jgi:hypothetical protein
MVQTKFYWSWDGGPVLIVRTAMWDVAICGLQVFTDSCFVLLIMKMMFFNVK